MHTQTSNTKCSKNKSQVKYLFILFKGKGGYYTRITKKLNLHVYMINNLKNRKAKTKEIEKNNPTHTHKNKNKTKNKKTHDFLK